MLLFTMLLLRSNDDHSCHITNCSVSFLYLGEKLQATLNERIMIFDGGMGTMIQMHHFDEDAFRGTQFAGHPKNLKGNNDLLSITQPETILKIHKVIN